MLTIGHSTHPIDQFMRMLAAHGIETLVDVRTIPRSRHNPQFNREALPESLRAAGIEYVHMQGLGGLRHARRDSVNTGWRNLSFRGFADYMQTPEFAARAMVAAMGKVLNESGVKDDRDEHQDQTGV